MSSAFESFHLTIAAPHGDRYPVTARTQAGHEVREDLLLPLDDPTLNTYQMALDYHTPIDETVVIAAGQLLYQTLFQGTIAEAFATARTHADEHKAALRIQLAIDTDTRLSAAAALPWELIATAAGRPLMLEHALVRTFPWNDPIPDLDIPPSERIRLAVTSALPTDLADHPIAAEAEVAAIRAAITHSARPIDLIEVPHLARERLTDLLTNQRPHIVHHIGHGSIQRGMGYLDIERADQSRDQLSAREFSTLLYQSGVQLVVLNACHTSSAGESLLTSFAPIFITDRIPAVIGMQATILNRTGHCFANAFYTALGLSGSIDASMIAARKAIHVDGQEHGAWGVPTLYSRVPHSALWQTQDADHASSASAPTVIQTTLGSVHASQSNVLIGNQIIGDVYQQVDLPEAVLKASLAALEQEKTMDRIRHAAQQIESDRLLNLRLKGFVGRVNELADIREQIATMRPTGGYVLIKAAAGEGKSSSIAKLIHDAGITKIPHHFIALTTGREYQLGLLRAVVAQLILKHNLKVSYFPEESYPAMKAEFARILHDLSKHGIAETIYLDGLDQLQPESDGSRDLSFLPPQPPPSIVIVLGSRPDETLKPLEILHRIDYDLPPLSEGDALALWRSVQPTVADALLHDLYTALKGNALFVHLAADTMRDQSIANATSLIRQIEQNPQNLFGITLDRMKGRSLADWRAIWKPILALLLVTQEPLRLDVVGDLIGHDHDTMQDAVWVLGGLVSQGIDHRVAIHHLLFRDYLATSVFNDRDIKRWQQRLADWCAKDVEVIWEDHGDAVEQARRVYARHHYIAHLFLAENWPTLWQVLDVGDYGEHKTRFDPSTRLYVLDLDRGRESAIRAGQSIDEHIQHLPRLWKYSLLRTSLTSRVDQWPDEAFEILAMVGRTHEVLERIELLSRVDKQISCWIRILPWCSKQQHSIIMRLSEVIRHLLIIGDTFTIHAAAKAVAAYGNRENALAILDTSLTIAQSIGDQGQHSVALSAIAEVATTHGDIDRALTIAKTIADPSQRHRTLGTIAKATAINGHIDRALTITQFIDDQWQRTRTLSDIAEAAATHGHIDHALTIAKTITDPSQRPGTLGAIAEAAATHGHIDHALTIAKTITDPSQRATTRGTIAKTAATNGHIDRALTIAQSIVDPSQRSITLGTIAKTAATNGHIDRALTIAQSIVDPSQRATTLGIIAETTATSSNMEHALAIAQSIADPSQRGITLGIIAKATATRGHIDHALTIAKTIADPSQRGITLSDIAKATATRGHIDHALTIAKTIADPWQHLRTLGTIAKAAATNGHIDRALTIVQPIVDPSQRATILYTIAEAAATRGQQSQALEILNSALTIAKTIVNPSQRATILYTIAEAAATRGQQSQALEILNSALAITKTIINPSQRGITLDTIATSAAIYSYIGHALTIVQSITDASQRGITLRAIAEAAAMHGDADGALTIAQSIADPSQHVTTIRAIAEATATRGDIGHALTIAQSINNTEQYTKILSAIAKAAATNGDIDLALTITQSIADPSQRATTLGTISKAAATNGHIDRALTIAKTITDPSQRATTLGTIAEAADTCGDIERAMTIAKTIGYPRQRPTTLGNIAKATANRGDINRALTIAQSIADPSQRGITLGNIAKATATHGDINRALTIAKTITYPSQRGITLGAIAEAAAAHGDVKRALTITHSISYLWLSPKTFSAIAEATATHGNIDHALTMAQSITDASQRATTLGTIAEAAATHGHIDRALTILQTITNPSQYVDTLKRIVQIIQSVTEKTLILQKIWFHSTIADDLWAVTSLILPLLKDNPWLGVAIIEGEAWVNEQLKRLG